MLAARRKSTVRSREAGVRAASDATWCRTARFYRTGRLDATTRRRGCWSAMDDPTDDAGQLAAPEGSPERARATGPPREGAPIAIAIGFASAIGFAGLAFLMAFAFFAAVAIYALVKAIGGGEESGNPVVVALITV